MKIYTPKELSIRNKVLVELNNILKNLYIKFFLIDGVLLGAIREGDFIKWDWDIELAVLTEDVIETIEKIILEAKKKNFKVENPDRTLENLKINFYKYDVKISLIGLMRYKNYRQRKLFRYPAKYFEKPDRIFFRGEEYLIPTPVEELLEYTYGKNWRIPKISNSKREYLSPEIFRESYLNKIRYKIKKCYIKLLSNY